jgi:hypothetical protein
LRFHKDDNPVLYIHPSKQGVLFRSDAQMGRTYGLMPVGVAGLVNVLREDGIPYFNPFRQTVKR